MVVEENQLNVIYEIVTALRERSGRTYTDAIGLMSEQLKFDYPEATFNKLFRRKALSDRGFPRYQQDEVEALIYAYSHQLVPEKGFTAFEAIKLFDATRMSFNQWNALKKYFDEENFNNALADYMRQNNISSLTPDEELFHRLRPARHKILIGRNDDVVEIKRRLGVLDKSQRQSILIIRGWPGVGKTAFINEIVNDKTIEKSFEQGILWMDLGRSGNIFTSLQEWARQFGAVHLLQITQLNDLINALREVLRGKDVLLVADDVWTEEMGKVLIKVVDPESNTLLITTRFTDVATALEDKPSRDQIYILEVLSEPHAFKLLETLAPEPVHEYQDKMPDLIKTLEGLPLALQVAGRLLDLRYSMNLDVESLLDELINDYNTLLAQGDPNRLLDEETGQTPTIELLFKRSVQTLTEEGQMAFAALGVFREKPATFALEAMKDVWEIESPDYLIMDIVGRGLLEATNDRRFRMHQTLHMYANKLLDHYDETGELGL